MNKHRGYLAVIGSAGAIFWPGAFWFGYPGVMGPLWQQERYDVGRGEIGNTLFFVLATVGIFMFFVGRWQERWGARKLVTIGALLCGLNTFLIAYADRLWLLYLWAFLIGAASSFIYIPGLTTVQRWFPERRGLVSGLCQSGIRPLGRGHGPGIRLSTQNLGILGHESDPWGGSLYFLDWPPLNSRKCRVGISSPRGKRMAPFLCCHRNRSGGIRSGSPRIKVFLVSMVDLGAGWERPASPWSSWPSLSAFPAGMDPGCGRDDPDGLQPDQRLDPPDHGISFR